MLRGRTAASRHPAAWAPTALVAFVVAVTNALACQGSPRAPALAAPPAPAPVGSAALARSPPVQGRGRANGALPSRKVFFEPQARSDVKISPDGQRIGWLAPVGGVLNVWVGPADDVMKAQPVTHNGRDDVHSWWWAFGGDRLLVAQDHEGDEKWHIVAVDFVKKATRDLTPIDGVRAELVDLSPKRPQEALIAINDRDQKAHDVYLVDLASGARKLAQPTDGGYRGWIADGDLRVRYARHANGDGSFDLVAPALGKEAARPFQHIPLEDALALSPVDFDKTGSTLLLIDSRNRDTSGLFAVDTKTGAASLIADDAKADVAQVLIHPTNKTVEAVSLDYERPSWKTVDASVEGDFYYLQTSGDGSLMVPSRTLDEQRWIVGYTHTDGPTHYYRYDRDRDIPGNPGTSTLLFNDRDDLERIRLSAMVPVVIPSRDGLGLVSYLTIPYDADPRSAGRPSRPLPMVLLVHDGPWTRASLEFSAEHQWLASRGYVVLTVNYRGSTGFGKRFANAGNLEWGGKMNDDLVDSVRWAVDQKIADPAAVAITGEGYGGYAALAAMAFSHDVFACAVDFGGPSNLFAFLQAMAVETPDQTESLARRVGDANTDEGKKLLADRSPWFHLDAIKGPLLIGQGRDDSKVKEADTGQFVAALQARRVPVTYAVYDEEEGTLTDPSDRTSFSALAEVFLGQCLGGEYRPIGGDLAESTVHVPVGADAIAGVRAALAAKK